MPLPAAGWLGQLVRRSGLADFSPTRCGSSPSAAGSTPPGCARCSASSRATRRARRSRTSSPQAGTGLPGQAVRRRRRGQPGRPGRRGPVARRCPRRGAPDGRPSAAPLPRRRPRPDAGRRTARSRTRSRPVPPEPAAKRARRRRTPLLSDAAAAPAPGRRHRRARPAHHRRRPRRGGRPDGARRPASRDAVADGAPAPAGAARRRRCAGQGRVGERSGPARPPAAAHAPASARDGRPALRGPSAPPDAGPTPAATDRGAARPGVEELVHVAVAVLRSPPRRPGSPARTSSARSRTLLAFLRRRLTGDYTVDEFGFDEDFTEHVYLPVLRPLYRVVVPGRGARHREHPRRGRRAGRRQPLRHHRDGLADDPGGRPRRAPGAPAPADARRRPGLPDPGRRRASPARPGRPWRPTPTPSGCCSAGELVGVWPEGFKGIGKPFSERYKLQRFGRGGFVSAALRTGAPIIPCSIVGAEEIYPIRQYVL